MSIRALLLGLFVAALAPATAAADTFCVADTSCPVDHRYNTIADALAAADANGPGSDLVKIGPGTFHEHVTINSRVFIQGAGGGQTVIDGSGASGEILMDLGSAQSTVAGIDAKMRANSVTAFRTHGNLKDSSVEGDDAAGSTYGVIAVGSATLQNDVIKAPGGGSFGVLTEGTGTATVTDTTSSAPIAFEATEATNAQRIAGDATFAGLIVSSSAATVDDARFAVTGDNSMGVEAYTSGGAGPATIQLRGTTVFVQGASSTGVLTYSTDFTAATVHLQNTVVSGATVSLWNGAGSGSQHMDATYSDFDPATVMPAGTGAGAGNINVPPGFVDPAHDDFRLRADSQLIDLGSTDPLAGGESTTDLLGAPRVIDGNGDGTAVRDIGAIEFQDAAPVASAAADPAGATPGQTIAFSGSATDADVGDTLAYSWSCDDGATATGASFSHAFAAAGAHACTLTARDHAGKTGTADAAVTVTAPQSTTPPPTGGGPPPPTTTVFDPGLSFAGSPKTVKLSKKGAFAWKFAAKPGVAGKVTFAGKHLRLGKATFKAPVAGGVKVTVKLSKALRKKVRKLKKVKVTATVVVGSVTKTATFTLKA